MCDRKPRGEVTRGPEAGEPAVGKVCRLPGKRLRLSMYLVYLPGYWPVARRVSPFLSSSR